jgi:hypothetical protein
VNWRLLSALLLAATIGGGCDSCSKPSGRPPALDPSASLVHVDPPSDASFERAWTLRMSGLSKQPSRAAQEAVRYRVTPDCKLSYQLRARRSSQVAAGRPPTEDVLDAALSFDVSNRRHRVHLRKLEATFISDGVPRKQSSEAGMPTVEIGTDGQRWSEVGGPSTLWAAHSAVPALITLFPPIPDKPASGSTTTWEMETYPVRVTTALPRARAKAGDKRVPDPLPNVDGATVVVSRYLLLGGGDAGAPEEAVVLEVRWSVVDDRSEPTVSQQRESWRGRYLVSASGRLVHALLMANISSWWSLRPGESNVKHGSAEREIRLVGACDGVVLPAL